MIEKAIISILIFVGIVLAGCVVAFSVVMFGTIITGIRDIKKELKRRD